MKIDENSVKINEIDDDDDDDCGGDGGSSSILYLKTPDQPPLAATMLLVIWGSCLLRASSLGCAREGGVGTEVRNVGYFRQNSPRFGVDEIVR